MSRSTSDSTPAAPRPLRGVPSWVWLAAPCVAAIAGLAMASLDTPTVDRPEDSAFLATLGTDSSFDPYELQRIAVQESDGIVGSGGGSGTGVGEAAGLLDKFFPGGTFVAPARGRMPRPRSPLKPTLPGDGPFG
ncbi:MAG: hypothetical protein AAF743_02330 [Planctomycetota bacterium]